MSNPSMIDGPKVLDTGVYYVSAACPLCGAIDEIAVRIGCTVTVPDDDAGKKRVTLSAKSIDHDCGQKRLRAL